MSTQKRLFLLDAYALIFRGYYAFIKNPRINSKGLDTSAIMGFMNSLMDVIKREKPDHLAVAFDKGGSDLRNDIFPEYKANRDATPDAIKIAVPYIQELLRAMHIPIIEVKGYEADDLIGTIAKQAEKQNYQVFMVTPDKDFAQLVSENIFMYKPARMGNGIEIWGIPEVLAKFEIDRPEQVIDFLGMMGDAADNIPGLPGVGEVTAKKLLKEFGSMENLLANTDKLKGKMKENIDEPLIIILTLNTISHTVGAILVGVQAKELYSSINNNSYDVFGILLTEDLVVGIVSGIMTILILLVSEIIPKTLGATYWHKLVKTTSIFLKIKIVE